MWKGAEKGLEKYDTGIGGTKRESKIALVLAMKGLVALHCEFEIDFKEKLLFQRID